MHKKEVKHFAEPGIVYANGDRKTACGIRVKPRQATGTAAYVTCKRCKAAGY